MKRLTALICALLTVLTAPLLSSCSKIGAISVSGTEISDEVFIYYINKSIDDLGEDAAPDDVFARAVEYVRYYVKTNTLSAEQGIVLNISKKSAVAQLVNNTYSVYGSYYAAIGVSKQTLTKVFTCDAYESSFLDFFYGPNGLNPATEEEILQAFNENVAVFKSINGYYTKINHSGETVSLTEAERDALVLRFKSYANKLNSGDNSFAQVLSELSDTTFSGSEEITVIRKDSAVYPDGFFDSVAAAEAGAAVAVETESCAFLVQKIKITTDSTYYRDNCDYVLSQLKGSELEALLASQKSYTIEYLRPHAVSIYNKIISERSALNGD